MKNIALIYGTNNESTTGIADKIAEILIQNDFNVVLQNIAIDFDPEKFFSHNFVGFILGSGIQMGYWAKLMKKFISKNLDYFIKEDVKLGMFISCGTVKTSEGDIKACARYVKFFAEELGLTPDLNVAFGDVFDFSDHSNLNNAIKYILKNVVKKKAPRQSNLEKIDDSLNWDDVVAFANNFSALF